MLEAHASVRSTMTRPTTPRRRPRPRRPIRIPESRFVAPPVSGRLPARRRCDRRRNPAVAAGLDQTPDQAANRRNRPPLQAPGRTDAGLAAQEQPDVAGGRLEQHALADILVTAHPHATHTARLIHVRESPLHHLAPAPLQATTPPTPHTTPVPIQRLLRSSLLRRLLPRLLGCGREPGCPGPPDVNHPPAPLERTVAHLLDSPPAPGRR